MVMLEQSIFIPIAQLVVVLKVAHTMRKGILLHVFLLVHCVNYGILELFSFPCGCWVREAGLDKREDAF